MWLSQKLIKEEIENSKLKKEKLIAKGEKPVVSEKGKLEVINPYGVYSLIPVGETVLCDDEYVLGVNSKPSNLPLIEAGEICLYSKGGYILIKNSGEIIVNGKTLNL